MPDQTVQVTFTPPSGTTPASWTFNPDNAVMTAAGKVIFTKFPANQAWNFSSASVKQDTTGQFHPQAPSAGQLSITDDHSSNGSWSYTVTVATTATPPVSYTSPDPQITNSDPTLP